ncbi:MAG: hypothetical protein MRY64_15350, partial [Hyphomonadaceae bacterium]|nr:hypothetical protein [Hyphomonadaceae bacterium]
MTQAKTGSARRLWAWAFCALLLVLALGIAAAWIWRKPLVSWAAETSCAQHGLICRFELKQVSLDRITADGVSVSARNGETPLAAERLSLDLVWDSPISPRLTALSASAPRIRAAFDGQNVSLYGLEEALPRGNGDATPWPRVDAAEGQLEIETPAGHVSGNFNLALISREDATAQLTLAPADLETETGRLVLASGIVDLTIQNGTPGGVADLEITTGRFGAFSADSALLRAELVPGTREGEDTLRYRLAARELALNGYGVQAATSSGDILLALPEGAESGAPLPLISGLIGSFEADALTAPGAVAERVNLEIDLARNTAGGIEGPVGLTADQVDLEGHGSASDWVLTGTARQTTTGELNLDGRATARAIALAPQRRGSLAATVSPRNVFPAHGAVLETAIERGLARFDTGLTFSARRSRDGRIQIRARGPLRLTATSGLRAGLLPFGETAGLIWQDGALTVRGALSIEGGGAPHLVADLNELSQRPEGLALNLTDLTLSPWQEDEL